MLLNYYMRLLFAKPIKKKIAKPSISIATIVEPTGVPARIEIIMPDKAHTTENIAEQIVTARKFLNKRIAESAGKITRADISREPTRFIANTMMTAMITAIKRL